MANPNDKLSAVKTPKAPRVQRTLFERMKEDLTNAALRSKISVEEMTSLEDHLKKLKAVLS